MQLTGIHHLTAVTADAPGNLRFYTKVLGMRLVKKTVNQDDTSAYHLFYADAEATPGTDVTFFDWPVGRERRGTNSIIRTSLRVNGKAALEYWHDRLIKAAVSVGELATLGVEALGGQPWRHEPDPASVEAKSLAIDASLAKRALGFESLLDAREAVDQTMAWYRRQAAGEDALALCVEQIERYEARA